MAEMAQVTGGDTENLLRERGIDLFTVQLVFVLLALLFTFLRVYVKVFMVKKTTPDDWTMYAATGMYVPYAVIAIYGIFVGGTGKHSVHLTPSGAAIALRSWYLCEVLYVPVSALARTSIALFLLRITNNRYHRWILYATLFTMFAISVVFFFVMTFQCSPPSYFWEQVLGAEGKCIPSDIVPNTTIAHSVICAVCDWTFGLLPVAMLWKVQLNRRTKVGVAVLLGMGIVAGVALIVRIPYIRFLAISTDFLFETIDVAIWTVMEPGLGIMAGCAATMRPLIKAWGFGPRSRQYAYNTNNSSMHHRSNGASVWGTSRAHMQKLSGKPCDGGSDIELNKSVQSPGMRSATIAADHAPVSGQQPEGAINVCTSIDVMTEHTAPRKDSESSDDISWSYPGRLASIKPEPARLPRPL
ncbi:integral membrane protein [Zalerion maritima]|uniref:Integral membrane protein n=1 Tax=Zalerion maritima TaxID=339359 RepID=A0AAD5RJ37_9PEZI|nr:integral membrane protein [Zalerion maritima]